MLKSNNLLDPELIELIKNGGVGIMPTDTVYGLICSASNEAAVARLYALKDRESKPGTVIAGSVDQLVQLGIRARYVKPIEHYWPNPISVVIPNFDLKYIHLGVGSIAMRIPRDNTLLGLLQKTGPILTSSANQPGQPEAKTIAEAEKYFGEAVDFYIDGGDLSHRKASTVIRIIDDAVEVLREGSIKINEDGTIA